MQDYIVYATRIMEIKSRNMCHETKLLKNLTKITEDECVTDFTTKGSVQPEKRKRRALSPEKIMRLQR